MYSWQIALIRFSVKNIRAAAMSLQAEKHRAPLNPEQIRLEEDRLGQKNWRRWGPYVSERSWGTVREDYSVDGDAWSYLTHDQACSKAYRWGEDGLAGICDRYQLLIFAIALWNGRDPILKERLFGVVPREANHGEDVKEYYYYLDATPTHSYLKYLYKYPQAEYPYRDLVETGRRRGLEDREYELLDTGIFDDNRYFDVQVEYAKADTDDLCVRIEIINRGPETARIHLLPHLWYRNRWAWTSPPAPEPTISCESKNRQSICLVADGSAAEPLTGLLIPYALGKRWLYAEGGGKPLFTNNESNINRLFGPNVRNRSPFVKDAFHRYVINGENCTNPQEQGTKACIHYRELTIKPGASRVIRLRLSDQPLENPLRDVDAIVALRKSEADEFYADIHPPRATEDERLVQRQALAGMIWSKQIYLFDVRLWLEGDNPQTPPYRRHNRNVHWKHLNSMRILSMPDKWEYPWFAAWDLAFQTIPLTLVDPEFAKEQLWLLLFEQFQHPNGQIPAYEWEFSDLNPPVHAWAVWRVYNMDRIRSGRADRVFLEKCFHKLLINFAWWVNKVDAAGNNIFEGGFLGLDNITTFDR
ncbi:MAG: MGH1-like glycoside hydrolase domain-containing protein, partial [Aureliella sp.]